MNKSLGMRQCKKRLLSHTRMVARAQLEGGGGWGWLSGEGFTLHRLIEDLSLGYRGRTSDR